MDFKEFVKTFSVVAIILLPFYLAWLFVKGLVSFIFD